MTAVRKRKMSTLHHGRRLPPVVDYSDVVTDEHLDRIRELVSQDESEDTETVSGPGW